jgi:EmrB/QacA subfamily drug resistance transporter
MDTKRTRPILIVLYVGVLMGTLDIAIVAPALPQIQQVFNVTARHLSWVFAIYVLFNLIGTPIMSKLSDMYGRRLIYVIDVALFAAGSLLVVISPRDNFSDLLIGRAAQGFGSSGIFPVASAVIGDILPPERRGRALGIIGAMTGLAFIIGPLLGGLILSVADYRWLFVINLPIALVIIISGWRVLPSMHGRWSGTFDLYGVTVMSLMLSSLTFGVNQINTSNLLSSLSSPDVWPFFLVFICLLPLFIYIEAHSKNPLVSLELFKGRQLSITYLISIGIGIGESSLVFMPLLAVTALGVAKFEASFLLLPGVLALAIGSPLVGRLLDHLGSRAVILGGTILMIIGMMLIREFSTLLGVFILAGICIGAGLSSLLGAPLRYIILNEVHAWQYTTAQGVLTLFLSIGQLVGSALVGAVAQSGGESVNSYTLAYMSIALLNILLFILALFLKKRTLEQNHSEEKPFQEVHSNNQVME